MRPDRMLLIGSLAALIAGTAVALLGAAAPRIGLPELLWFRAHGALLVYGFVLPALFFLHLRIAAPRCPRAPDARRARVAAVLLFAGAGLTALGFLLQPSGVFALVALVGALVATGGGVLQSIVFFRILPRRGESVVDVERDVLTKGDDASLKHITFAHRFLPIGLLLLATPLLPFVGTTAAAPRLWLTGLHVLLVGYGLLSVYGLAHLAVPRYSGVPAIAAGAVKGELHSTLPALLLLPAGFLVGHATGLGRGFLIAGGAFAFLGIFVFMGVLGANIMKNKSRTQRVTPAFAYIPWTFAGILWLVCGVLMGWFLNMAPPQIEAARPQLAHVHAHFALLGGIAQLYLGFLPRELAAWQGRPLEGFTGAAKASFLALNTGLLVLVVGVLAQGQEGPAVLAGGLLVLAALLIHLVHVRKLMPAAGVAPA